MKKAGAFVRPKDITIYSEEIVSGSEHGLRDIFLLNLELMVSGP